MPPFAEIGLWPRKINQRTFGSDTTAIRQIASHKPRAVVESQRWIVGIIVIGSITVCMITALAFKLIRDRRRSRRYRKVYEEIARRDAAVATVYNSSQLQQSGAHPYHQQNRIQQAPGLENFSIESPGGNLEAGKGSTMSGRSPFESHYNTRQHLEDPFRELSTSITSKDREVDRDQEDAPAGPDERDHVVIEVSTARAVPVSPTTSPIRSGKPRLVEISRLKKGATCEPEAEAVKNHKDEQIEDLSDLFDE